MPLKTSSGGSKIRNMGGQPGSKQPNGPRRPTGQVPPASPIRGGR